MNTQENKLAALAKRKTSTMKIMIDIECETINELWQHLEELQRQIIKQTKVNKANPLNDDFAEGTQLYDDNCYGSHEMNVLAE